MTVEETKKLVERRLEMWNTGNLEIADEIFAEDFVSHESDGDERGVEAFKRKPQRIREALPDAKMTYSNVVAEDDRIAYEWTIEGTHQGRFAGVDPTGNHISFSGSIIARVEDGRFVEEWVHADILNLLEQLEVFTRRDILAADGGMEEAPRHAPR